jgi:hypothetical protein
MRIFYIFFTFHFSGFHASQSAWTKIDAISVSDSPQELKIYGKLPY